MRCRDVMAMLLTRSETRPQGRCLDGIALSNSIIVSPVYPGQIRNIYLSRLQRTTLSNYGLGFAVILARRHSGIIHSTVLTKANGAKNNRQPLPEKDK